jgi:hypothetical protein
VSTPGGTRRHVYGDIALVVFLLAQVLDGALTYLGVTMYGAHMEGNPIIVWLMGRIGEGPGLATAKVTASFLGILLHLSDVHKAVALLAVFYVAVAIVPWTIILFLI